MEGVELYYLVAQDDYDSKFKQKPQLNQLLETLAPRLEKRVRKILEFLLSTGISWNVYGIVNANIPELATQFPILDMVVYAAAPSREREPLGFSEFLKFLARVKAPLNLFCKKVSRKLEKIIKNAKTKRAKKESTPQEEEDEEEEEIRFE